ncbi:MAG: Xaa-Pro dipeptidase [Myxococcales bacterium]|nr:Xaa-Pro dipeptidase [Myxococcales bacterium]
MLDGNDLERLHGEHVAWLSTEYARSLGETGWDAVLVHSGRPAPRTVFDDQFWPLRPTPHFQHFAPLAEADCALLVVPGRRPTLLKNVARDFWERPALPESEHYLAAFDVVEFAGAEAMVQLLPSGRVAFIGEDAARATSLGLPDAARCPAELMRRLDQLRVLKTPYEIVCLAEANRIAARGHHAVLQAFRDGAHAELDLHLVYLRATRQDDPETPYKNIVALGAHAATLHHVHYGRRAPAGGAESLLLDAGATCHGYASDITRTFALGAGAAVDAFRALIAAVERLQQTLCAEVVAGRPYEALHDRAHELLAGALREVGIARASTAELVGSGATRAFLPHGLGHSLGLQCHDVGCAEFSPRADNPFLRNTTRIAERQVFTIEPGCYFIDEKLAELRSSSIASSIDWSLVSALARFGGVRIEDDLVVCARGAENLTRAALGD